ncbi:Pyridine nucleotide-disulfide oxidoreductase domain-containing protein 1, partial [Armadillidium vulgare]
YFDRVMEEKDTKLFKYIIIGGGIAGVTCAEQLQVIDEDSSILLLSATDFVKTVTNVQFVTKTLEYFDVQESSLNILASRCPNVTVVKSYVNYLDSKNKIINSTNGLFKYEKLCICSGATPKVIFPKNPNVLWIRDTESVRKFQKRIANAKRIVIVGNGGIATELVYELSGVEVIWAIKDKTINAVFIDGGAAAFLKSSLEKEKTNEEHISKRRKYTVNFSEGKGENNDALGGALGPDWHLGLEIKSDKHRNVTIESQVEIKALYSPEEFENRKANNADQNITLKEKWPIYVELTNGNIYGCDFIVSATGVTPNTEVFLKDNNFELGKDGGLLVNDRMETSISNIYSAGDVCSAGWNVAHHWFQYRLWTQARQMGAYAAKCMWASLSHEEIHMDFCFEMFAHVTKFMGYKVILLGLFNGQKLNQKYEILLRTTKDKEYIKCVMVDGKMQGAILIGETDLEETFENLILNQMDLSSYGEDLLDPSVDIEDYFD